MKYSTGFKNSIIKKVLPPDERSIYEVAEDSGVSYQTIKKWLAMYKDGKLDSVENNEPTPNKRSADEKFVLVLESKSIPEDRMGEWLRQNGLHSEHIPLWEKELEQLVNDKQQNLKEENKQLKSEMRNMKKKLRRNEKAMSEALALLTLKKKADKLFNMDEDE